MNLICVGQEMTVCPNLKTMTYGVFMKQTLIVMILMFTPFAYSGESCKEAAIGLDEKSDIAEKLFYTGTCHYRNKEYGLSVKNWEKLSSLTNVDPAYEEYQIDVLNNLGYMKFYGYGTNKNQRLAVDYWQKAILMGHEEAEYHLCHAYADEGESTFHLAKAKKHCKKALLIYRGMDKKDMEIINIIEKYKRQISR